MASTTRWAVWAAAAGWLWLAAGPACGQAMALKAGTDGAGLELQHAIGDQFGARLQFDYAAISHGLTETGVHYHALLRLRNVLALADWHPLGGVWRVSGGLVYNLNVFDLTAQPTAGTFTINGNTYPASSVGSLRGTLNFSRVAPYLGTGWGTSPHGHGLFGSVDLGLHFQNHRVALAGTCGAPIQGTPACNQLASDVVAEQGRLEDKTSSLRFWPLAQIGIGWRFF